MKGGGGGGMLDGIVAACLAVGLHSATKLACFGLTKGWSLAPFSQKKRRVRDGILTVRRPSANCLSTE